MTGGSTAAHLGIAYGHVPRNLQPCCCGPARSDPFRRLTLASARCPDDGSGVDRMSSWVYGCLACCVTSSLGPLSTICPAYMTEIVSAHQRADAMSCVAYSSARPMLSRHS